MEQRVHLPQAPLTSPATVTSQTEKNISSNSNGVIQNGAAPPLAFPSSFSPPASDASAGGAGPVADAVLHAASYPEPSAPSSPRPCAPASSHSSSSPLHSRPPSSTCSHATAEASPQTSRTKPKPSRHPRPAASRHYLRRALLVHVPRLRPLREVRPLSHSLR
jgi:hypothetical protein